jgi:hypothetical protein
MFLYSSTIPSFEKRYEADTPTTLGRFQKLLL